MPTQTVIELKSALPLEVEVASELPLEGEAKSALPLTVEISSALPVYWEADIPRKTGGYAFMFGGPRRA